MGATDQVLLAGLVVDPDRQNEWFEVPAHIRLRKRIAGQRTPTHQRRLQKLYLDRLGFTGTQSGMSTLQRQRVQQMLEFHTPSEVRHGDCIGADADFDLICLQTLEHADLTVHIHPWNGSDTKRAYCHLAKTPRPQTVVHAPAPPLDRNRVIVDAVQGMIATPREELEEIRSGTWATIRYTISIRRWLWVIFPTGRVAVVPGFVPE